MGRSREFSTLRRWAMGEGMGLAEALERACAQGSGVPAEVRAACGPLAGMREIVCRQAGRLRVLRGRALLEAVALSVAGGRDEGVGEGFVRLFGTVGLDETAADLAGRVRRALAAPRFSGVSREGVKVALVGDAVGLDVRVLVVAGFVNGFAPPRICFDKTSIVEKDARAMRVDGMRALYPVLGCAHEATAATYFTRVEPDRAQRLDVRAARIRVEDGRRVCVTEASEYLDIVCPDS